MERFEGIENALYSLRKTIKGQKDDLTDDEEDFSPPKRGQERSSLGAESRVPFDIGERHTSESW